MNAIEIDRTKNVLFNSLMKNYVFLNPGQLRKIENTDWVEINNEI